MALVLTQHDGDRITIVHSETGDVVEIYTRVERRSNGRVSVKLAFKAPLVYDIVRADAKCKTRHLRGIEHDHGKCDDMELMDDDIVDSGAAE